MQKAQQRNAARQNTYAFRQSIFPSDTPYDVSSRSSTPPDSPHRSECTTPVQQTDMADMTINEIINGVDGFPGLMGVVNAYLNSLNVDLTTKCELRRYLDLIKLRARGDLVTPAAWIRTFITTHPAYRQDSVVSDEINHDLAVAIDEM